MPLNGCEIVLGMVWVKNLCIYLVILPVLCEFWCKISFSSVFYRFPS